ncbi:MAG: porin [Bacteroidaceae bacterium]|nr:porin [Bacteroidaceae bacterium]MBR6601118.1 porin [Bacteroidaceae bacterium]
MKKLTTWLLGVASLCTLATTAQENPKVDLRIEARGDLQNELIDGNVYAENTGFRGKQLNLRLNGNINDSWSYAYRQRMGKPNADASYFDAVDHINLTYTTGAWAFTGGKQTVAVGGYEYDRAPIDFYFGSEYWYNMACYQWGVGATYTMGNDALKLQLTQSPFRNQEQIEFPYGFVTTYPDIFSYNLMWSGSHGWIDILHSVNMVEYQPGKYVNFIALGHQFNMGDFHLQLDWMNRADMENFNFWDFSVMADLSWAANDKINVFGKFSYDENGSNDADYCVLPGTELTRVGAGFEYFPIEGSRDIRFHGGYSYAWGTNGNPGGTVCDAQSFLTLGVTWKMSILKR